jgi:hypothetical protein
METYPRAKVKLLNPQNGQCCGSQFRDSERTETHHLFLKKYEGRMNTKISSKLIGNSSKVLTLPVAIGILLSWRNWNFINTNILSRKTSIQPK